MSTSAKPLIVVALASEDQGALSTLGYDVVYCGVGKINASYHLTRALHISGITYPYVLNLGSAGSHTFNADMLVEADRFVQRDMDVRGLGFELGVTPYDSDPPLISFDRRFPQIPVGICATGDSFLEATSPLPCDIVDMEAYALAKVCKLHGISFSSVKYITDGADGLASRDWRENLKNASKAFIDLLRT